MFFSGFGHRTETKGSMKMRSWNKMAVTALAALGLFVALAGDSERVQAANPNTAAPTSVAASAPVNLPPVLAEVLRMSEAGMSDDVITAYLQRSANAYPVDADQIIYLHDMGVSSAVLDALVNHAGMATSDPAAANETADTGNVSSAGTPPVSGAASDFYDSLAPYGTWVNVPNYGWCWQPTVVVVDPCLATVLQQRVLAVDGPGLVLEFLLLVGLGAIPLRPVVPVSGLRLAVVSR